MTLTVNDFPAFFADVRTPKGGPRRGPFRWQQRLMEQVARDGEWPDLLDLPTGSGKTAVLDVALFLLALRDDQPRRIVFVVDRRIVVHQATQHAKLLKQRLSEADTDVLREVRSRLRARMHAGELADSVELAELRGGIERDDDWAHRPDVPTIVVSTVDQVGSRLLFRGYGVSAGMAPVHAGLLGNDVLFLLDEVHLARPFADTLAAIGSRYRPPPSAELPERWRVVELSATPTSTTSSRTTFELAPEDRDPEQNPVLARRLRARKLVTTKLVRVTGKDTAAHRAALARSAVAEATVLLARPGVDTVGVVVNRVDTAVHVQRLWSARPDAADCVLLTGRMRPLDRDRVTEEYAGRLFTGRQRPADRPLLVVATQAIEAGADLDLDALVTECAPLDALIQRFGRVDRTGDLTEAGLFTTSVVLATSADIAAADDPVYGDRLAKTWAWLTEAERDFGPDALTVPADLKAALSSATMAAPALLPSHLDRWVQTSHRPDADPEPDHWLHGLRETRPEVGIVWRADLSDAVLTGDPNDLARAVTLVSTCPPGSGEALQVPLAAARQWLAGESTAPVTDTVIDLPDAGTAAVTMRPALVWAGDRSKVATRVRDLRPDCVLVVPAGYGGIRNANWDPACTEPVPDLGASVQLRQRGQAVLRVHPTLLGPLGPLPQPDPEEALPTTALRGDLLAWLDDVDTADLANATDIDPALPEIVRLLKPGPRPKLATVDLDAGSPPGQMFVLRRRRPGGRARIADSEPSTSSFTGEALRLSTHLANVKCWAHALAESCGLPPHVMNDLALAGELHDLGKVDPRFQLMLRQGAVGGGPEPLAKSTTPATDYRARRRAQLVAGYPIHTRHELASVALISGSDHLRDRAHDWDLVLHLVSSHHGFARPFMPVPEPDPSPVTLAVSHRDETLTSCSDHGLATLDAGVPARFWLCVRRYGWYGLAWMEAILRLADHRASEQREEAKS